MGSGARRIAGVGLAVAFLGGAFALHQVVIAGAADDQGLLARNDANRHAVALAELARRDLEKLLPTAVAGASVQELQAMVRSGADALTFQDFMMNEGNWKGFRTAPISSAIYLDGQRLAQTSPTFPGNDAVQAIVEGADVQGRGRLVANGATLTTVVAVRLPVVTRGDAPREAVLALARPLELPSDGTWMFSDGKTALAINGPPDMLQLLGREKQTPLAALGGMASAIEVHPGLWAWSLAPLPPPASTGLPAVVIFGAGGLLALGALGFGFRVGGPDEKEALIVEANKALRQSQEQLKRLTQQLETEPAPVPLDRRVSQTALSMVAAPQPSRYEVIAPLGEGGMARVYLAVTRGAEGFKRAFVLKRLRPEIMGNPDAVTQFIDEARLGSSLVHSNIVPVFDFGRDEEGYYLAQEYILGRDLDAVRKASLDQRRTSLDPSLVLYVAQETLKALDYAHTRTTEAGDPLGLVHRDVSPNNLMISAQGEVKLLDLGIAKSDQNLTKTQAGIVKGNVFYMSPEQARGEPIDGRADLFSLGLVLFMAATGDSLYQGASNYELLSRAGKGLGPNEWSRVKRLDPGLAALLERVLQPVAADRFSTAKEFAAALPTSGIAQASSMQALMTELFGEELRNELQRMKRPA